ncbi:purine-cytosine permease family protein [Chondrinema litorale]|uniref:purine-cytosine permease family protein n=1 Tax=Chondrinema litorale TaxID=2994555 RepID=UPI002543623F|nr:hypothetical protein [Chondrinema litorale]UZR93760.1 hypothetical protein OQ292_18085 [Chondrinema litorale]
MNIETSKTKPANKAQGVNEYERERVPDSKLKGIGSFVGMYAGEHAAGTEFVIGPLFVAHGVSAVELVIGLLIGNLLAVLSWALICAPIAVKNRITLYYQLEKICGSKLVNFYNIANGLMFCFLAGSMIAVSATAIGIPFNMKMPGLNDFYPNSISWILAVFFVGAIITVVAMRGYEMVAKVANIAAPWMILVFLSAGIAVLPELGVSSIGEFWSVAKEKIWVGATASDVSKFNFWHVTFFAWFANMAMHIGMADMSVLRYAKKWQYGFSSATGVYIGHYMAWIAAGILYSVVLIQIVPEGYTLAEYLPQVTSGDLPPVAPGPLAFNAAGLAGAICVVIAGWTTANPTIYRAGLAFQSIFPKQNRMQVTMIAGAVATIGAIFPALVMKLLDFVALYGLVLMPMGAVIFIDHYFMKKFNLHSNYAELAGIKFNAPAGIAWIVTLCICVGLNIFGGVEIFFLGLPGWFIAAILYIVSSKIAQKKQLVIN